MQATLIENNGNGKTAYDSLVLSDPKAFSALNNKLSLKIVKSLAESPASPIDISRRMKIHEQKVYYHMRKLEKAGIIYIISNEKRQGMVAKIFSVVSPVISAKLYEKGVEIKENIKTTTEPIISEILKPFIENNKLNAKLIIGDPSPHGEYDSGGMEGAHISDITFFLGKIVDSVDFPTYRLDTETTETDLQNNLILIGNPKTNIIIKKIVQDLPIKFNSTFDIIQSSNRHYKDDRVGFIVKLDNPFLKNKKILVIGGLRSRGIRSASTALTRRIGDRLKSLKSFDNFVIIVQGLDKDGDKIIDDVIFLE